MRSEQYCTRCNHLDLLTIEHVCDLRFGRAPEYTEDTVNKIDSHIRGTKARRDAERRTGGGYQ